MKALAMFMIRTHLPDLRFCANCKMLFHNALKSMLMRWLIVLLFAFGSVSGLTADAETKHKLTPHAVKLFEFGPFTITNSMLVTWMVAALIIFFSQRAMRNATLIPSGLQNFWEWLIEELYTLFEGILGARMVKKTFWFFATIFIFILFTNWFGLLPGVGTIGWGKDVNDEFHLTDPLFRGVNADLNMTAAMALSFFVLWFIWSLRENGLKGFLGHIFAVKGHGGGPLGILLVAVFIFVGLIEIISISVRPIALMFRLYGNIFAGENILETMIHMRFGWLLALPFYFLEILVGFVQALVFALLTSTFTAIMCQHEGEHADPSSTLEI